MTVKLCDICRKEINLTDQDTISKISFGNYSVDNLMWHSEFDLCPECGKALNAWLNVRKCLSLSNDEELDEIEETYMDDIGGIILFD